MNTEFFGLIEKMVRGESTNVDPLTVGDCQRHTSLSDTGMEEGLVFALGCQYHYLWPISSPVYQHIIPPYHLLSDRAVNVGSLDNPDTEMATEMSGDETLATLSGERCRAWSDQLSSQMLQGSLDVDDIAAQVLQHDINPRPRSGAQEKLENTIDR